MTIEQPHFAQFRLKPIEGSSEKVNKVRVWIKKIKARGMASKLVKL